MYRTIPFLFASAFAYSTLHHFDPALHAHSEMPAPVWQDSSVASIGATGANAVPLILTSGTTGAQASAVPPVYLAPPAFDLRSQAGDIMGSGKPLPTETG